MDALLARGRHPSRQGRHPDTIPPPQMVANMKVGKMNGFASASRERAR
jgi:hypothetical protein